MIHASTRLSMNRTKRHLDSDTVRPFDKLGKVWVGQG